MGASFVICLGASLLPARTFGMFALPSDAPVGRLIANVTAHVRTHPADPEGYYVLGRIHCFAFVNRSRRLSYHQRDGQLPAIEPHDYSSIFGKQKKPIDDVPPTMLELGRHLTEGVVNLQHAVERAPKNTQFRLGLAYLLEQGADRAADADVCPKGAIAGDSKQAAEIEGTIADLASSESEKHKAALEKLNGTLDAAAVLLHKHRNDANGDIGRQVRPLLSRYWRERSLIEYARVFNESYKEAEKLAAAGEVSNLSMPISWESGLAVIRLIEQRGPKDDAERSLVELIRAHHAYLHKHEQQVITPIIFRLDGNHALNELLSHDRTVGFDLDGSGRKLEWPWIRPETALLVWDPTGHGDIRSGRQLFGSVTWWMFFRDGYHAMDALDDDRNGWLEGHELHGVAAWLDRNSNGVSDPGEVHPLSTLGVSGLAVTATSYVGRSPMNSQGLRLTDGRLLPTYDWVTSPLAPPTQPPAPLPLIRIR